MAETPDGLLDVLRSIAADAPSAATLRAILAAVRRATGARRAFAALRARASDDLLTAATDGLVPDLTEHDELAACRLAIELALGSGRIVSTGDAMKDDRFRTIGAVSGLEIRQLGAVPVMIRGRASGALCFHDGSPRDLKADAFTALADLAGAAATALELHRLREERAEDELTGGPTPRLFQQRLLEEVDRAVRHARPLALLTISVPAGQWRAVIAGAGPTALVARPTTECTDRLLALLPDTDRAGAQATAQTLCRAAGATVGIATMPADALDAETLLMTAQEALARAPAGCVFDFSGPAEGGSPVAPAASREGRALQSMLARTFASELDLQTQLDLAAAWIAGVTDSKRAILVILDEDGQWYLHGACGLALDEARKFAAGHPPVPVQRIALAFLDRAPAPFIEALLAPVGTALAQSVRLQRHRRDVRARREAVALTLEELRRKHDFSTIVGESPRILEALEIVVRAAPMDAPVLISGESGTGKELLARAVHANSPRRNGPFIVMNCAAVPPALLESELFGHVKGAFTGAISDRKGLFESADGGTLFLDEVADTTLELQAKLLRALQFGEMQPVGSDNVRHVSVRVVAASNKTLVEEVKAKRFREDLYYRINVFRIHLPPLRERPEDIPRLAEYYCRRYAQELKRDVPAVEPAVIEALQRYPFPGNVRELENVITRAFAYAAGGTITMRDLPEELLATPRETEGPSSTTELELMKKEAEARLELAFLTTVLRQANGNVARAARASGMNRTLLHKLLAKHGLEADSFKKKE